MNGAAGQLAVQLAVLALKQRYGIVRILHPISVDMHALVTIP